MKYSFFSIPVQDAANAEEDLNHPVRGRPAPSTAKSQGPPVCW